MLCSLRECQDAARMRESYEREGRVSQFYEELDQLLKNDQIDTRRISLRKLWETFVDGGRESLEMMAPGYRADGTTWFMESGGFVSTAAFSNIIGMVTNNTVLNALEDENFISDQLMTTEPADTQQPEQINGIARLGDSAEDVGEGQEYPRVGLSEEYVEVPRKVKDGFIVELSEEAIWEDKTGVLLQRANEGTHYMGVTMEKEKLDVALGLTTTYKRNGGGAQATYANSHTQGDFDNLVASNALADYTDIEAALLVLADITDPNTGDPVFISAPDIVVPLDLDMTAKNIINSTEIRITNGSSQTLTANPVSGMVAGRGGLSAPLSNAYVKQRTASGSTWFLGDFKKAFAYREVWPVQAFSIGGQQHQPGFGRDIVASVKVRRKGVPYVKEPRYVVKCTA